MNVCTPYAVCACIFYYASMGGKSKKSFYLNFLLATFACEMEC